jgi:hypothetical protein
MFQQSQNGALVILQSLDFYTDFGQPTIENRSSLRPFWFAEKSPNVRQFQAGASVVQICRRQLRCLSPNWR